MDAGKEYSGTTYNARGAFRVAATSREPFRDVRWSVLLSSNVGVVTRGSYCNDISCVYVNNGITGSTTYPPLPEARVLFNIFRRVDK